MLRLVVFGFLFASFLNVHSTRYSPQILKSTINSWLDVMHNRIVGGDKVEIDEIPYQVALLHMEKFICGGSIISAEYVITAAHCIKRKKVEDLDVRVGSQYSTTGGIVILLYKTIPHPYFNMDSQHPPGDYDVALLQLDSVLEFNKKIQPVRLTGKHHVIKDGTLLRISGWGGKTERTSELEKIKSVDYFYDEQNDNQLQAVYIEKLNRDTCNKAYINLGGITSRMFCAGFLEGGKDACQGDSGGPITQDNILVGIISWGSGCARPLKPGVYTHIASVRYWIKSVSNV